MKWSEINDRDGKKERGKEKKEKNERKKEISNELAAEKAAVEGTRTKRGYYRSFP